MNARRFLVTGGTLGSRVVDRLRDAGGEVLIFSRNAGSGRIRGDLATGEGLDEVVRGVGTIVHGASNPARASDRG